MYLKSILRTVSLATTLAGVIMFVPPQTVFADSPQRLVSAVETDSSVTVQLRELRSLMNQLNNDADQLQAVAGSRLHWQTHVYHLNKVKDHVNRIGDKLDAIQSAKSSATPQQQGAIDSVVPIAVEVAQRTSAAINHINDDRLHLWSPEYIDHLRTIPALSDEMHGIVDNHLKIVDAHDKLLDLQRDFAERVS